MSGLPRTGSTLLASILSQNPNIHAEGLSAVCNTMWNIYASNYNININQWNKDLVCCNRMHSIENILKETINLYYFDVNKKNIVDKCRTWTLPLNLNLIKKYITDNPKIIVLLRPMNEIVSSFANIHKINKWEDDEIFDKITEDSPDVQGVISAKKNNNGEFLFVTYNDIVYNTDDTLEKIYSFCNWQPYKHKLNNLKRPFHQNDVVYNMIGLHEIRKKIEKQTNNIVLPRDVIKRCNYIDSLIFED